MHVVVCGAGFGGLELTSRLSETFGDQIQVTLIDKSDRFIFGFHKFELMFGREQRDGVSSLYGSINKPGVTFKQELITSIDPDAKRVVTDKGAYDADVLVVALGADYEFAATPGFVEGGHEFYSVEGAIALRDVLPTINSGHVIVAVLSEPFKCPPAPCEAGMLLDEYFTGRGVRDAVEISVVTPWPVPIPPSPAATGAILARFEERGIRWMPKTLVTSIDPATKKAHLRDGGTLDYALFLGIPVHHPPTVVLESGLAQDGWIPVDKANLATKFPDVYAIGDVTSAPVPKAGIFAESAARAVADHLIVKIRESGTAKPYDGAGACFIEFGENKVGRVDVNFLSGPSITAPYTEASLQGFADKKEFAASRRARWFGG